MLTENATAFSCQISYSFFWLINFVSTMLRGTVAKQGGSRAKKDSRYRLTRLERKVGQLTPENKYYEKIVNVTVATGVAYVFDFTQIAAGTAENERLGDKVRIKSIKFSGGPTGTNVPIDIHIVRPVASSSPPVYSDFGGVMGGHYHPRNGWDIRHYYIGGSDRDAFYRVNDRITFKNPMQVVWADNASNNPSKNRIFGVIINRSGASVPVACSAIVTYTDM